MFPAVKKAVWLLTQASWTFFRRPSKVEASLRETTAFKRWCSCRNTTEIISKGFMGLALTAILLFPRQGDAAGQQPVFLGSADSFAVLGASTVTSTNGGIINGDVGVWTGTDFIVGVPPVIVNGSIHLGDPVAAKAQADLTTAYIDAKGRTLNVIVVSDGELGGKTLAPGLYKSAPDSFAITSVDLTLDAQGDPYAVWIFQMDSTLTVGNGRQVILAGDAQPGNIFWQVGSSATLGTTSVFKGNIMALASITVNTGAQLDGRALARTGAVTLDGNSLTEQPLHAFFWPMFVPPMIK
jgi:hypothetical protein